jgi:hypothetical protein
MDVNNQSLDLAELVLPEDLVALLLLKKFTRTPNTTENAAVFKSPSGDRYLVPTSSKSPDYHKSVVELAKSLYPHLSNPAHAISALMMPPSGRFQEQISGNAALYGSISLDAVAESLSAIKTLLRISAGTATSDSRVYNRVSDQAEAFAKSCQFGQTEVGSMIFNVFCPHNPLMISNDSDETEPIGITALNICAANIEYIATTESRLIFPAIPATLSSSFTDSVVKLEPPTSLNSFVKISISAEDFVLSPSHADAILLDSVAFDRAKVLTDQLRRAEAEDYSEEVVGDIVAFQDDPPRYSRRDPVHNEIKIYGKVGKRDRMIKLSVTRKQFNDALEWKKNNYKIRVRGTLHSDSHSCYFKYVKTIEVITPENMWEE